MRLTDYDFQWTYGLVPVNFHSKVSLKKRYNNFDISRYIIWIAVIITNLEIYSKPFSTCQSYKT